MSKKLTFGEYLLGNGPLVVRLLKMVIGLHCFGLAYELMIITGSDAALLSGLFVYFGVVKFHDVLLKKLLEKKTETALPNSQKGDNP